MNQITRGAHPAGPIISLGNLLMTCVATLSAITLSHVFALICLLTSGIVRSREQCPDRLR